MNNETNRSAQFNDTQAQPTNDSTQLVDSKGTTQKEAAQELRELRDRGFGSSNEQLAEVLGRSAAQIEACCSGEGTIDDDLMMKARALAQDRNIELNP